MKVLFTVIFCVAVFYGAEALKCYDCHGCSKINERTPTTECNGECVAYELKESNESSTYHRGCITLQRGEEDGCAAVDRENDKPVVKCQACKTDLCNNGPLCA